MILLSLKYLATLEAEAVSKNFSKINLTIGAVSGSGILSLSSLKAYPNNGNTVLLASPFLAWLSKVNLIFLEMTVHHLKILLMNGMRKTFLKK